MSSGISPERWSEVRSVFDDLVDSDRTAREQALSSLAQSDPELAKAVERLLDADNRAEERLAQVERAFGGGDENDIDPLHLAGRTISHFRVIEPLAGGGMGVIYKAEDLNLGRLAALKFPLPDRRLSRQIRERFLHEARSVAKVDHPNLCSIYEAGETENGDLFIAMPLYQGETLKERLKRESPLDAADALGIARQIAHGLGAAHKAGIVHRDLKPANVMLLEDGTVKILDFGLAKVSDLTLTTSSVRVGTAAYMSPEQIEAEPLDGRTDLWALGVVLYEMIAGKRPFEGTNEISIAHSILHKSPPALPPRPPDTSGRLERIVLKLLAKNRDDRFASAGELVSEIDGLSSGSRNTAPAGPRRTASKPFPRRNVAVVLAAAIAIGAVSYLLWSERDTASTSASALSIAVLPFSSTGDSAAKHVAIGVGDEVAMLLRRIKSLRVVNKTAVPLVSGGDSVSVLASGLGVSRLVTAHVERNGVRTTIFVKIFDVSASSDRSPVKNIQIESPNLQDAPSAVALRILGALRVRPVGAERALLSRSPTASADAYESYLRGRHAELVVNGSQSPATGWLNAQPFYWRAREIDPQFALARARLALTHAHIVLAGEDQSETRREQARIEAEAALRLHPDLPEAHIATGYYWLIRRDDSKALSALRRAMELAPSEPSIHVDAAVIHRRNGRWEDAALEFERALELEPDNAGTAWEAAMSYSRMRRYRDAIRMWNHALALEPDNYMGWVIRGYVFLRWQGQVDTLAAALDRIPVSWHVGGARTWAKFTVERIRRRFGDALVALDGAPAFPNDGLLYKPIPLLRGQLHRELGDSVQARRHFRLAEQILKDTVNARPDDPGARIALGLAYAGLGKAELATREARRAMELVPLSRDAMTATAYAGGAAEIYTLLGDNDEALKLLGLLLAMPAGREVSAPLLKVDPTWDPLRKDPRFERLLQQYSTSPALTVSSGPVLAK